MTSNKSNEDSKSYRQMAGDYYNKQYENWMPWVEDKYLSWFTNDNKASYSTKRTFASLSPVLRTCYTSTSSAPISSPNFPSPPRTPPLQPTLTPILHRCLPH